MKAIATTLLTLVTLPMLALAKGQTTHITLDQSGKTLAVMQGEAARQFRFDYAPFSALPTSIAVTPPSFPAKSWIVEDWFHPVPEPAQALPRVQVSFHLLMNDSSKREYVVFYVFDPAVGQGYIHLPGKGEKFYEANVFTLLRGPEYDGRWFRASAEWVDKARGAMAAAQGGAKVLFYGPAGSTANPMGPVGIHYWFENAQDPVRGGEPGVRIADPSRAAAGARVRLHVQANTGGFLSVWLIDAQGDGMRLTPWDGRYAGYRITGRVEQVIPTGIAVPAKPSGASVFILFSRSQTEQVNTVAQAREKLRFISTRAARDGGPPIVTETDMTTPGEIGTYVVHREGAQPAVEINL